MSAHIFMTGSMSQGTDIPSIVSIPDQRRQEMNEPLQCTTGIAALDQEVEYTQDGNATVCPTPSEYTSVSDEVEDDIIGQLVDERFLIQLQGSDDPRDPQTWR